MFVGLSASFRPIEMDACWPHSQLQSSLPMKEALNKVILFPAVLCALHLRSASRGKLVMICQNSLLWTWCPGSLGLHRRKHCHLPKSLHHLPRYQNYNSLPRDDPHRCRHLSCCFECTTHSAPPVVGYWSDSERSWHYVTWWKIDSIVWRDWLPGNWL